MTWPVHTTPGGGRAARAGTVAVVSHHSAASEPPSQWHRHGRFPCPGASGRPSPTAPLRPDAAVPRRHCGRTAALRSSGRPPVGRPSGTPGCHRARPVDGEQRSLAVRVECHLARSPAVSFTCIAAHSLLSSLRRRRRCQWRHRSGTSDLRPGGAGRKLDGLLTVQAARGSPAGPRDLCRHLESGVPSPADNRVSVPAWDGNAAPGTSRRRWRQRPAAPGRRGQGAVGRRGHTPGVGTIGEPRGPAVAGGRKWLACRWVPVR